MVTVAWKSVRKLLVSVYFKAVEGPKQGLGRKLFIFFFDAWVVPDVIEDPTENVCQAIRYGHIIT